MVPIVFDPDKGSLMEATASSKQLKPRVKSKYLQRQIQKKDKLSDNINKLKRSYANVVGPHL